MPQEDQDRRIDYIEFPVLDLEQAKRFYATVFGWSFTDYGPDYTSFADGRLSGGFFKAETVQPGGPLVVLYALDLEQVEEAVVAHGGTIVKETFTFPGGRRFHFRDPSGYELAVWSDKQP
jgi:predicted enzyme related to lactoylglutathione lyase